jgi:integrase
MELSIKLDLRKSGETENGFPIVVYASKDYKNRKWRTGHYAKTTLWNNKLAAPKSKHPNYYMLLDYLSDLKIRISKLLANHRTQSKSLDDIKQLLFKKSYDRFYNAAMENFPKDYRGTNWSAVRAFNNVFPNLLFVEITHEHGQRFAKHLLSKGNKPGGVDSYVRSLKAVWNRLTHEPNPFKGVRIEIPEQIKTVASSNDMKILKGANLRDMAAIGGYSNYRNYWLLMFYLGGIDPEVLTRLRYDQHVIDGRIIIHRNKGRSKILVNNLITDQAKEILKLYDCHPYLVPIYKSKSHKSFMRNFSRRMQLLSVRQNLTVKLKPKSPRYTFADRAQNLLIDERIASQIMGHKRKTTTSIYSNNFPLDIQDKAHKEIINHDN